MAIPATFGPSEIQRLKDIIYDGVRTMEEIESLKLGISDTITAVSEELQIPAKLLKKAISVSHKGNFNDCETELAELARILDAVGRK
jgi:hypothetical protein